MEKDIPKIKKWEELTLADNFVFEKFMMNEEMCKKILSEILGKEVVGIEYPEYEKTVEARYDAKGIRLDVYIKGENEVYNVEIQNYYTKSLPQRGRYYQNLIDLDLLGKGESYSNLCHSYVIFICTYDYYGNRQYKYTFKNQCMEVEGLEYGDGTTKIVLNTCGEKGEVSEDLKIFLKSINGVFSDNVFSVKIKEEYEKVMSSREWRREYMTLEMALQEQRKIGESIGMERGIEQGMERGIEQLEVAILAYKNGADTEEKLLKKGIEPKVVKKTLEIFSK